MHLGFHTEPLEPRRLLSSLNGLTANYYDNPDFSNRAFTRHDSTVDFDFGSAGPVPQMGTDTYSVRWQAQIAAPGSGAYTFYVNADDGVRLTVRGQQIVDRWTDGAAETSGTVSLNAGQKVDLQLDYYNDFGAGSVHLSWSGPGVAGKQIVPTTALYDTFGVDYTFTNPIAGSGADPWVTRKDGFYYYCKSDGGAIYVARSTTLQDINKATAVRVFTAVPNTNYSADVWAPELHYLDGKWYIYFAADRNGDNSTHRMYVLEGNTQDPRGTYTLKGKIAATTDRWAIDGTVLTIGANRYFVWSGWPGTANVEQDLYIAAMSNPWTISGDRTLISSPTLSWERNGLPINEGPETLQHSGDTFIVYSASGYWTNEYSLGQIKLTGANPLSAASWTKTSTPVFTQNGNAVGVGHASFTTSPDGTENWLVYHAHDTTGAFTGNRDVRMQSFTFNANGSPNFGTPAPIQTPLREPSGTPHFASTFTFATPAPLPAPAVTESTAPWSKALVKLGELFAPVMLRNPRAIDVLESLGLRLDPPGPKPLVEWLSEITVRRVP